MKILQKNVIFHFSILSWNDSHSSLRATFLVGPIVKFLASEQLLTPNLSTSILIAVLKGLQLHGQHESNQVCIILVYCFIFFYILNSTN